MAHSCVSTFSSLRFNSFSSLSLSSPSHSSSPSPSSSKILSLPFQPLRSRNLKNSNFRSCSVKAMYSPEFYAPEKSSRDGMTCKFHHRHTFQSMLRGHRVRLLWCKSDISQLFQYRIIRCGGAVDDDMANIIVAQLLYLGAVDPTKDIVMYVNSPGGSVTAGYGYI